MSDTTSTAFRTDAAILAPATADYLASLLPARDALAERVRAHGVRDNIPIVHDDTAQLLNVLVRLHDPQLVIEFGTAIGYSTLAIARAMRPGARLASFELDPERHAAASAYLAESGAACDVDLQLGDARELAARIEGTVDMAFLDATKGEYAEYLELSLDRMQAGSVVLVDNALMSGTVATGRTNGHWGQESIDGQRAFNAQLCGRDDLDAIVLPVGDGLAVAVVR